MVMSSAASTTDVELDELKIQTPLTPESVDTNSTALPEESLDTAVPLEAVVARDLLESMGNSFNDLVETFQNLEIGITAIAHGEEHPSYKVPLSDDILALQTTADLCADRHRKALDEIERILKELPDSLIQTIVQEVDKEIDAEINKLVKQEVEAYLNSAMPDDVRNEVEAAEKDLVKAQCELQNLESRRLNGRLKKRHGKRPLHPIYMKNGEISINFPKTFDQLTDLNDVNCKALIQDYELPPQADAPHKENLNRFMLFCGVEYQKVISPTSP
ncbi:hypothetical protein BDN72DRAFT_672303 [Pluteus cervinus]|uniref:Uncharacterized protein n=1 Tax=Pluteus cervinus TaxID=181527 RepID=A0ACD3BA20_9AGAR|nr:hypothetical protein BDN72DRAFT_672303 [Pluteus cervinus]